MRKESVTALLNFGEKNALVLLRTVQRIVWSSNLRENLKPPKKKKEAMQRCMNLDIQNIRFKIKIS